MQDVWALFECDAKKGGYFVDFGATNGTTMSNSLILARKFGWSGIVAEPNPVFHERLHRLRKCDISVKCVHSHSAGTLDFICAEHPMFSRLGVASEGAQIAQIEQTIPAQTISLNDLLDEYDAPDLIDFISIDTEGSEFDILSAFDFSKRRVNMFTIEHNFQPRRDQINSLMQENGYVRRFAEMSRFDDWYIRNDLV
ncbi:MAG: FkbM family methyltransferase [Alphaproteobacteria bacterium]|nr:FkbM family methyltransferase [Alphaproteobacteria bacterium]